MDIFIQLLFGAGGFSGLIALLTIVFRSGTVYQRIEALEAACQRLTQTDSDTGTDLARGTTDLRADLQRQAAELHGRISDLRHHVDAAVQAHTGAISQLTQMQTVSAHDLDHVRQHYDALTARLTNVTESIIAAGRESATVTSQLAALDRRVSETSPQLLQTLKDVSALSARVTHVEGHL